MDITPLLERLRAISNDELHAALRAERLEISDEKFETAFQCIGASHDLWRPDVDFKGPPDVPPDVIRGLRMRASVVFMTFSALCYMRSEHLERGLDNISETSPLRPFRDIYRAGCMKLGEGTLVQHVRNSLSHGTFRMSRTPDVVFTDRCWQETLAVAQLKELCEHVHRLYHEAFDKEVPRPAHWSLYGASK
ncbi:MAG: hypothetical protein H0T47_15390 [Planctomycetaceae bacterium]|nr:hypothetical protein [Planctomycetaceae bacterium]